MAWRPPEFDLAPGDAVLQTPCLTGAWLLDLIPGDLVRVGVDPIPENLQRARVAAARLRIRAAFIPGVSWSLPFADQSFHAVLSCGGLEQAPDPSDALVEMTRLLAPGGRVICVPQTARGALLGPEDGIAPRPLRTWEADDLLRWCDALGLSITESGGADGAHWAVITR